jgi:hypothetical protein
MTPVVGLSGVLCEKLWVKSKKFQKWSCKKYKAIAWADKTVAEQMNVGV